MNQEIIIQKIANKFARNKRYHHVTDIIFWDEPTIGVYEYIKCGYRKKTTDEYVPNAYRNNFGWKNTYYQHMKLVVGIPRSMFV